MIGEMTEGGERKRRWNPTVEQVKILERMYKEGNRSPTIMEIHNITDLLSRHGSVQGINVFYWFKNRKAKDKRNMHASGKWGGLKLNGGGNGCEHRRFISIDLKEVAASMDMKVVRVEVNGRTEKEPLRTLQLFPACEK